MSYRSAERRSESISVPSGKSEELRELRMMTEHVQLPRNADLLAKLLAAVAFAVLHLPYEELAARLHNVGHDMHASDDLESPFDHEPAEGVCLLRVALKERPDVCDLVERKPVFRILLQQMQGCQDMGQTRVQVLLPREEDGAFPVRMGDVVQHVVVSSLPILHNLVGYEAPDTHHRRGARGLALILQIQRVGPWFIAPQLSMPVTKCIKNAGIKMLHP
jgi:hypothetical protein